MYSWIRTVVTELYSVYPPHSETTKTAEFLLMMHPQRSEQLQSRATHLRDHFMMSANPAYVT